MLECTHHILWGWRRLFLWLGRGRLDEVSASLRPCMWLHRTVCASHHFTFFQLSHVLQCLAAACVFFPSQLLVLFLDSWCLLVFLPIFGSPPQWLSVIFHPNVTCGDLVLSSQWSLCKTEVCVLIDGLVGCSFELRSYPRERAARATLGYGGNCCHHLVKRRYDTAHCIATQAAWFLSIKSLLRFFIPISVNHCFSSLLNGNLIFHVGNVQGCSTALPFLMCLCGSWEAPELWEYLDGPHTSSSFIDFQHSLVYLRTGCCANSVLILRLASSPSFWEFGGFNLNLFLCFFALLGISQTSSQIPDTWCWSQSCLYSALHLTLALLLHTVVSFPVTIGKIIIVQRVYSLALLQHSPISACVRALWV